MYENLGVFVGRVWSLSGSAVSDAIIELQYVNRMQIATLDKSGVHPSSQSDDKGKFILAFRWSAADIAESMQPVSLGYYAYQDDVVKSGGRLVSATTVAKLRSFTTGYLIYNPMQLVNGVFPDLTSLPGIANFTKDLMLAFRKVKIGPLHLPQTGMMSTENYGIVAGTDIWLDA
jgi:hypothetical protein